MSDHEPLIAAETLALTPTPNGGWLTGTAQGVTDEDGYTSVLVDGPPDISDDEDTDSSATNTPMPMQTLVRPVANQERVVVVTAPSGVGYALPYSNGLLGVASIEGGASDIPVVSTSPVAITDLEVEVEILWPGHLIEIEINALIQSNAAANLLIGRVIREDDAGATVEVGRFMRDSQLGNGQTLEVGIPVKDIDPEPGIYSYRPTIEAGTTGWSILLSAAADTVASFTVTDAGPLPTSAVRT